MRGNLPVSAPNITSCIALGRVNSLTLCGVSTIYQFRAYVKLCVCERERERGGDDAVFPSYLVFTQYILSNRKMKSLTVFKEENSK